ncbi:MAG: HIT family hydrolase [Armatimonadetes bacterium CG2_30_59_28]|nr:HIT domain-containing protein [Armatimonadota bacterium]OIO93961.1 MAG: HIT family hydrolase [Armatimonadetes bacterium CG2_30_59_28]PIU61518.1 MAG: HIT family hydrolase [Armatimonadetes bacterium CG07_land_8_20_14_0_80_59_28]PIY45813.1 MAG: HIT family hydrolase [Armatimonadetes bacterium CG_4_10_14_3_um_filter_59_10]PJB66015.1 MAG: HIT family hydrolase [Armatimonadetes bacterium CG_4_9_14_3_um_filter_58_7]
MQTIIAPWRMKYIMSEKTEGCIFCDKPTEDRDRDNLILVRGETCFVMLNAYPYSNGHLMVVPYRHQRSLADLSREELAEWMTLCASCEVVLRDKVSAEGFNIGINLGKVAGAGIEEHVHLHIVPRWHGDTNFMPVLGDTKVVPDSLGNVYDLLCETLQQEVRRRRD